MISICMECGEEFSTFNYKNKYCKKCYNKILEKAIKELQESWSEYSNPS